MPFDALLSPPNYIAALFREASFAVINLKELKLYKVPVPRLGRGVPLKIPHFGLWGRWKSSAYLPLSGSPQLAVLDTEKFKLIDNIKLPGLPVFAAISPDGRFIAVNYSGQRENYLTLIDRKSGKILSDKPLGRRIMHFRFSPRGQYLVLSSYFEHRVKLLTIPELRVVWSAPVPSPSGIFIPQQERR